LLQSTKKRDKRKVEYTCAGADKRAYTRASTRNARAPCVLTFRVRGTCERNTPELQNGLAPHKGNDMCRLIDQSSRSIGVVHSAV